MEQLKLQFKYIESEYVEAVRNYILKKIKIKTDIFVALSLIAFGIIIWGYRGYSLFWLSSIIVGLLFISTVYVIYYIIPPITFRKERMFQEENLILINEEGIFFRTNYKQLKQKWSEYKEILENEKFFYLVYGKNMYTIIPKRAFDSDEINVFKNLIEGKLVLKSL